ncbi:LuxR C-terminal-related transcriptional regulator [Streptomyces monashensis]|uniref:LuxR C-terminal-related transcriptional regulator n=1 Tax=Streptomyces monashensis TaxID=1678012 RepID=UPI0033FA8AAE
MRRPTFRRVRLEPLGPADTAALAERAGCREHAAFLFESSGGNPLLLRALLEEHALTAPATPGACRPEPNGPAAAGARLVPDIDGPFVQAVHACLHRAGATAAAVAQAAALLDEAATPERIAELAGIAPPAVRQGLAGLRGAGLLADAGFPHPAVRDAVLNALSSTALAALHRRAALLLHRQGCPALAAAGHLLSTAALVGTTWSATDEETELLCDAAESRLAEDDGRGALGLLQAAHRLCGDEVRRSGVAIRLAQVTWRFDPPAAERLVAGPLAALSQGRLDGEGAQPLSQLLVLQGRLTNAARLLGDGEPEGEEPGASPLDVLIDAGFTAERLLRAAGPAEATMTPIVQALRSLLLSDHPERAVPWSRTLLEEAERRAAPGWAAVFATLHAQALLRIGDLAEACAYASRALDMLPERSVGAFPYAATAVLIRARSAMGHYTEASRLCDRPVPAGLLDSLDGLAFLHARGLHHLTGNQPQAALADFLTVGRIMEAQGIDRPAFLPWRTDAAQALLCLGKSQQAERLVLQQLELPDARRPWVRGVSLHQRALTVAAVRQRVPLLEQAVNELHRSGDRLATARAMADLGRARQSEAGAPVKGTATVRAAWNLAKECGATALCKEILPDAPLSDPAPECAERPGPERLEGRLSSSEQRVATLAARGLTNREISAKLYLTVSTVEQHLTKVYRKLRISGRGDLPFDLSTDGASPTAGQLVRGD